MQAAERIASREAKRRQLAVPPSESFTTRAVRAWRAANDYRARFKHEHPALKAAKAALRIARKKQATPPWVDLSAIEAIYVECERIGRATGVAHEVDHIWPLAGKTACGLHVPWNLQIIPATENRLKGNKEPIAA